MSKRGQQPKPPATKAAAEARVAQLERRVRSLERQLESSARHAEETMRNTEEHQRALGEALEQQAATSEILRVISSSPTDLRPVFDAMARSAARLCEAEDARVHVLEGDALRMTAALGPAPVTGAVGQFSFPVSHGSVNGRAIIERRVVHVADLQSERAEFPFAIGLPEGQRTSLAVPLLREGTAVGTIFLFRTEVRSFSGKQIALLQTFADQAVIAIEAGKMEVYLERFAVPALVEEIATFVRPLADRKGNALVTSCAPEVGEMRADQTKVRQTLYNLLSNACKFTEGGTVSLAVRREPGSARGADEIVFEVADTGIGISEEQMGRLFQDFSQADASTAKKYAGTGLGLALSRRLCRMMGGDIAVSSEPGHGSRFTARLPVEVEEPGAVAGTSR